MPAHPDVHFNLALAYEKRERTSRGARALGPLFALCTKRTVGRAGSRAPEPTLRQAQTDGAHSLSPAELNPFHFLKGTPMLLRWLACAGVILWVLTMTISSKSAQTNPSVATSPTAAAQKFAVLSDQVHEGLAGAFSNERVGGWVSRPSRSQDGQGHRARRAPGRYELGIHRKAARFLRRMARTVSREKPPLRTSTRKTPPIGSSLTIRSVSICSNSTRFKVTGTTRRWWWS